MIKPRKILHKSNYYVFLARSSGNSKLYDLYMKKAAKVSDILFPFYINRLDCEPTRTAIIIHVITLNIYANRFNQARKLLIKLIRQGNNDQIIDSILDLKNKIKNYVQDRR